MKNETTKKDRVGDKLNALVECPWCPDAGEVAVRDETLHGHPVKRAGCGLCGVAGPFGQTDREALDYFQQAFNRELYGNVPYWLYEQMCECEVKE